MTRSSTASKPLRISIAVIIMIAILGYVEYYEPPSVETWIRKFAPFTYGGENTIKIVDFPDTPPFKTTDGHFFDVGIIYKSITIFSLPVWNYHIRWCGYIENSKISDQVVYVEFNRTELEKLASLAHVSLPHNTELPFWETYGGKMVLILLSALGLLLSSGSIRARMMGDEKRQNNDHSKES